MNMSVTLPESVDAWRMVSARRSFEGELPIAAMKRLVGALANDTGTVRFELDFDTQLLDTAALHVRATAPLTLVCQRTLEPFVLPVTIDAQLGLIRTEREEAALPLDFEPLLVADDGKLNLAEVIEDELLLALPLVPVNPDSRLPDELVAPESAASAGSGRSDNPFAILRELKK